MQSDSLHVTKLAAWLDQAAQNVPPVRVKDIAARAEMSPEALRNVARGIRGTTYAKAELISTATGGVVSVADILGAPKQIKTRRTEAEA